MTRAETSHFSPIQSMPGHWEVNLGGGSYLVEESTGVCTCPDFRWRACNKLGASCKHARALADYLRDQKACPVCSGLGAITLRERYPGTGILLCAACGGSGQRDNPEPERLTDADLRDLFS